MDKFLILVKTRQCKVKGSKCLPVEAHGSRGFRAPMRVYFAKKRGHLVFFILPENTGICIS